MGQHLVLVLIAAHITEFAHRPCKHLIHNVSDTDHDACQHMY